MKVFLSWSGDASHALASILHEWLPSVLQFVDPWMSSEDIRKGSQWNAEMGQSLRATSYCIVCVTPGVHHRPWVNFEAGAISTVVGKSYVSPLLLGVSPADLGGLPLSMYQATEFNKEEVRKLLESINGAQESPILTGKQLAGVLKYSWDTLRRKVENIDLSDTRAAAYDGDEQRAESGRLNDKQEAALIAIADKRPTADELAACLGESQLRTKHHIDVLERHAMVSQSSPPPILVAGMKVPRQRYFITSTGRDYLVRHNLIE